MFEQEYGEAAVEVLDILDNTNKSDVGKIPESFIKFLVEIAKEDYRVNLDHSKPMSKMNLKEKTQELLGYIYINWWCNADEKVGYLQQIKELETKREEKKKEKYNPNKLFENKIKQLENIQETEISQSKTTTMIEYKDSIFKRIWSKILSFLKK